MTSSCDTCRCGKPKRLHCDLCFNCKEAEKRQLVKEGKLKIPVKERICNTCFVLQEGTHPKPRCNRCENRLKAVPGILPLYHWALSQCRDANRKRRIQRAIDDYCDQNPLVARQFRRIQAELDDLKNQIVPIVRTHNKTYGLVNNVDPDMRITPRKGPPTPDDLDELIATVWKEPAFFPD